MASGAVTISDWSWVNAVARALTALFRATLRARTDSTSPVRAFGVPDARPEAAALAAAYASIGHIGNRRGRAGVRVRVRGTGALPI
jgi:hypothetical protein